MNCLSDNSEIAATVFGILTITLFLLHSVLNFKGYLFAAKLVNSAGWVSMAAMFLSVSVTVYYSIKCNRTIKITGR